MYDSVKDARWQCVVNRLPNVPDRHCPLGTDVKAQGEA